MIKSILNVKFNKREEKIIVCYYVEVGIFEFVCLCNIDYVISDIYVSKVICKIRFFYFDIFIYFIFFM